jgi:chemotaxis signal transduction protein
MQTLASAATPALAPELLGARAPERVALRQLVTTGELRLVLKFADAREYTNSIGALTRVPGAPVWLLGIYAWEGTAVPLVDLAAWAQRTNPAPWTAWREGETAGATAVKGGLHALRFGEGAGVWAIRVSQAPSVFDPNRNAAEPFSNNLPLQVSSSNGRLMAHLEQLWRLSTDSFALQVRWNNVHAALLQELSGAGAASAV